MTYGVFGFRTDSGLVSHCQQHGVVGDGAHHGTVSRTGLDIHAGPSVIPALRNNQYEVLADSDDGVDGNKPPSTFPPRLHQLSQHPFPKEDNHTHEVIQYYLTEHQTGWCQFIQSGLAEGQGIFCCCGIPCLSSVSLSLVRVHVT